MKTLNLVTARRNMVDDKGLLLEKISDAFDTAAMASNVWHLPAELHRQILQYVDHDTMLQYRIASKYLCAIATEELFSTLTFHHSTWSVERLIEISKIPHIRTHIKTIIWDTSHWQIPNVRTFWEWKLYLLRKGGFYRGQNSGMKAYGDVLVKLAESQDDWEAYLDKVKDEKAAKNIFFQSDVFSQFPNLHTIHVSDGVEHQKPDAQSLCRGEGWNGWNNRSGLKAFQWLQKMSPLPIKTLRLDKLSHFGLQYVSGDFSSLTSLDLHITARMDSFYFNPWDHTEWWSPALIMPRGYLRKFITGMPHLHTLQINLRDTARGDYWRGRQPLTSVDAVFGPEYTWPKLRHLSLRHFFATPDTLFSLLSRHRATLRHLSLCNIFFDDDCMQSAGDNPHWFTDWPQSRHGWQEIIYKRLHLGEWPAFLQAVSETLRLQRATVSGGLATHRFGMGWFLGSKRSSSDDRELGAAVSQYLVSGGVCPLNDDNVLLLHHWDDYRA